MAKKPTTEPVQAGYTLVRIMIYGGNPDTSQYKVYSPRYGFSFEGQEVFMDIPVPVELVLEKKVIGKGAKAKTHLVLSPLAGGYILKYLAQMNQVAMIRYEIPE